MTIKEKNCWLDTVTAPPAQSLRDLPDDIDVVVAAGGFCGLSPAPALAKSAALVKREFNHELRIIPKSELRAEIGSDIYFGGLVDETSAGLNPAQYVAGLALAAQRAGASPFDHTRVTSVDREKNNGAGKFYVQTSRGAIR